VTNTENLVIPITIWKIWMCYSSLITSHPVILGIQLHHSFRKHSKTNPTAVILFPAFHTPGMSILTYKCRGYNLLYIQVISVYIMRNYYATLVISEQITFKHICQSPKYSLIILMGPYLNSSFTPRGWYSMKNWRIFSTDIWWFSLNIY
jgi:hypothetical protein